MALASAAPTYPIRQLINSVKNLRALAIEGPAANELLGPLTNAALAAHRDLAAQIERFGWAAEASGVGSWQGVIDLHGLGACLQKFLYERLGQLGSGSYGVVYKARNRETNEVVAIKKLRHTNDESGLPDSTIREISTLRELRHPNIVQLLDIISTVNSPHVYLVLECLDCDLRNFLDTCSEASTPQSIKSIIYQIVCAVHHAHSNLVLHRDLKPQNILVDKAHGVVKLTDFGLARQYLPPFKAHTEKVVTLYYRAPELLLGGPVAQPGNAAGPPNYSSAIDLWSVGCIMAELANYDPLFRADSEIGLIHKIFEVLGTPSNEVWQGVSNLEHFRDSFPHWPPKPMSEVVPALRDDPQALHLLSRLLTYDPRHRITAAQALDHPWFYDLKPSRSVLPGAVQLVQPQQQQQAQLSQQGSQVTVLQQAARQAAAAQQQQVQVQQQAALQAQAQQAALQQAALAAAMQQAAAASAYSGGTGTGTGTGTSTASVQQLPMMHAHMGLMGQAATAVAAVSGASC